ncbi:hypothetical protein BH09BAC4_BH09BAC4_50560 [soil metagenome]
MIVSAVADTIIQKPPLFLRQETQKVERPTIAEQYGIEYRGSLIGQIGRIILLIFTTPFAGLFIGPLRNKRK